MGEVKWWHFTKPFLVAAEMHRIRMALNTSDWWQQCLTSQGLSGKVFLLVGNSPGQPIFKMCVKLQLHQVLDHGHRALWPLALALWLHSNPPTHTRAHRRDSSSPRNEVERSCTRRQDRLCCSGAGHGQTSVLTGKLLTHKQLFLYTYPSIFSSLVVSQTTLISPCPAFIFSPNHPIINLLQSQNAFACIP